MNRLTLAIIAVALVYPGVARADDDERLEEVQVTASRGGRPAGDISEAVTVVDGEAAGRGQIQLVTDALRSQTGVFVQQTTAGQGTAIVRGLKGSEVLHLVDGMRLNNALFRNAPNQYMALVDPFLIERVEVVRGPLSTLYGSDAMGGVLQVVTERPFLGGGDWRSEGRLLARYDSATLGRIGHAGFAAGAGSVGVGGSVSYQDHDDVRADGRRAQAPTDYLSRAASVFAHWRPENGHEWGFSAQFLEQPSTPRYDELVPGFGQTEPASDVFLFEPNSRLFLHAEHRSSGWAPWLDELEVHLGMQRMVDNRRTRDFGATDERREQNSSRMVGLTVRGTALPRGAHALTYGIDVYHDEVRSARQAVDIVDGGSRTVRSRFPDGSKIFNADLYVEDEITVSPDFDLSLGARLSRSEVDLAGDDTRPDTAIDNTDVTGSIGARYQLTDAITVMANVGRGFRAPNIFDLGTLGARPGNRFNIANPDLGPETVWTVDSGIRFANGNTQAELFVWYSDYQDKITSVSTGEIDGSGRDIVQSRNADTVTLRGAEAAVRHLLNDRFEVDVAVNYTWGETDPADRIPPLNGRAALRYSADRWWLESELAFAAEQDRLSARDVRDPRINPDGTAGWGTLNLRAGADLTSWLSVTGAVNNVADKAYREHGSGLDARGRSVTLTLDGRF